MCQCTKILLAKTDSSQAYRLVNTNVVAEIPTDAAINSQQRLLVESYVSRQKVEEPHEVFRQRVMQMTIAMYGQLLRCRQPNRESVAMAVADSQRH